MRGVDWQWEDQDGGNGRRGKVTEILVHYQNIHIKLISISTVARKFVLLNKMNYVLP